MSRGLRYYEDYKQFVTLFAGEWFIANSVQCAYYELGSTQDRKDNLYGDLAPPRRNYIKHNWGHIGVVFKRESYTQEQDRYLLDAQERATATFYRQEIVPSIGDHFCPESQRIENIFGQGKELLILYIIKTVIPSYDGQFYSCSVERSKSSADVLSDAQLTDCTCDIL